MDRDGVGVGSFEVGTRSSRIGIGGGLISDPGESYPESSDSSAPPKSVMSRLGVSRSTTSFQEIAGLGDERGDDGEYLSTISTQRSKMWPGICNFQFMVERKAISFTLRSQVLSPDILLQALAEKFRS